MVTSCGFNMTVSSRPILQLVHIPQQYGYLPVSRDARWGEHSGYVLTAWSNAMLSPAKRSI